MNEWIKCPQFDSNLKDIAYAINVKHHDWVHMNYGIEGSGKSTLGMYACTKVDPSFNIDRIVFTMDQFKEALKDVKRGQAIMADEMAELMFSRDWNTKESKELVKYMMIMRHRNAFLWMNIPDFKYVDVYVRQGRLRSLTRTITRQRRSKFEGEYRNWRERGFFIGYTRKTVMQHLIKGWRLKPLFMEEFPNMKKMGDDAARLVGFYDRKKDNFITIRKEKGEEENDRKDRLRDKGRGKEPIPAVSGNSGMAMA